MSMGGKAPPAIASIVLTGMLVIPIWFIWTHLARLAHPSVEIVPPLDVKELVPVLVPVWAVLAIDAITGNADEKDCWDVDCWVPPGISPALCKMAFRSSMPLVLVDVVPWAEPKVPEEVTGWLNNSIVSNDQNGVREGEEEN
nr:hypothetical protein BaRGS_000657 [Batillaria attramentaria]